MSDLDVLEEIAEQTAFGNGGLSRHGARGHAPRKEFCGAGHPQTPENTRTYRQGKRIRAVCRVCDKARTTKKRHVHYSARGYPL